MEIKLVMLKSLQLFGRAALALAFLIGVWIITGCSSTGMTDRNLQNFDVNGFQLGSIVDDTSKLTPVEPLAGNQYEYNFAEIRYSLDEYSGVIYKMIVYVYETGIESTFDAVSEENEHFHYVEEITNYYGNGKHGWHDREQGLRFVEYTQEKEESEVNVRFVYNGNGELVWVIAQGKPNVSAANLVDRRPMLLIDDTLYLDTGREVSVGDTTEILGVITTSVSQSEVPDENNQSNFDCIGSGYALYENGVVLNIDEKWFYFEKSQES